MPIRVMIVDDSAVMRKLLTMALRPATDIEVVAMASNGREALDLLGSVQPDLVTLDVEMPEMDGLATMQAIHAADPDLAVIMCSGLTEQHAVTTINALRAGAVDYITKPMASSSDEALQTVHDQLVPKIRVLGSRAHHRPRRLAEVDTLDAADVAGTTGAGASSPSPTGADGVAVTTTVPAPGDIAAATVVPAGLVPAAGVGATAVLRPAARTGSPVARGGVDGRMVRARSPERPSRRGTGAESPRDRAPAAPPRPRTALRPWPSPLPTIDVVAIGVSTGGPVVLERVIESLPEDFPVPIVIVQHMPPLFTTILAERIDGKSALAVREVVGGELLVPGTVWLAPGGLHLKVRRTPAGPVLRLDDSPPENSCKPSVDVLFRSVASTFGAHALAVVCTGMGRDGTEGAQAIVEAGGVCVVQDEATSTVWGMPGSVARRGVASAMVPLDELATCIEKVVSRVAWSGLVDRTA